MMFLLICWVWPADVATETILGQEHPCEHDARRIRFHETLNWGRNCNYFNLKYEVNENLSTGNPLGSIRKKPNQILILSPVWRHIEQKSDGEWQQEILRFLLLSCLWRQSKHISTVYGHICNYPQLRATTEVGFCSSLAELLADKGLLVDPLKQAAEVIHDKGQETAGLVIANSMDKPVSLGH